MKRVSRQRIHIAPVGFEIDRVVLPAVMDKADKVYLMIHDNPSEDKATKYAAEIEKRLKAAKIKTEFISCDWRNIEEITRVTRDLILKESDNEIAINLASGSKNHAIAMDRACMTLRKRWNLRPFYAEAEEWHAFKFPKQMTTGVKDLKPVPTHRIIVPEPELINALKIIRQNGHPKKGIKKKQLAEICENHKIIEFSSQGRNQSQVRLTTLDRNILQPLKKTWKAVHIEKVGQNHWVTLTDEGTWLYYTLYNEETF